MRRLLIWLLVGLLLLAGCKSLTYEQGYLNGNIKYPQSEPL